MPVAIILLVNPAAGGGRAEGHARRVARALREVGEVVRWDSEHPGDERRLAREAARAGVSHLAVVGGDGALHHAARGLLDAAAPPVLVPCGGGTGNDFAKSLALPVRAPAALAARVAAGRVRRVDVGAVDDVPFVNAASFGFGVEVLRRLYHPVRRRGTLGYLRSALGALFTYPGFGAALAAEPRSDRPAPPTPAAPADAPPAHRLMLVFCNGGHIGAAFHIAPGAVVDDGALDVIDVAPVPLRRRAALFARAVRGAHLGCPGVAHRRGARFTLTADAPLRFEADGELHVAAARTVVVQLRTAALVVPA